MSVELGLVGDALDTVDDLLNVLDAAQTMNENLAQEIDSGDFYGDGIQNAQRDLDAMAATLQGISDALTGDYNAMSLQLPYTPPDIYDPFQRAIQAAKDANAAALAAKLAAVQTARTGGNVTLPLGVLPGLTPAEWRPDIRLQNILHGYQAAWRILKELPAKVVPIAHDDTKTYYIGEFLADANWAWAATGGFSGLYYTGDFWGCLEPQRMGNYGWDISAGFGFYDLNPTYDHGFWEYEGAWYRWRNGPATIWLSTDYNTSLWRPHPVDEWAGTWTTDDVSEEIRAIERYDYTWRKEICDTRPSFWPPGPDRPPCTPDGTMEDYKSTASPAQRIWAHVSPLYYARYDNDKYWYVLGPAETATIHFFPHAGTVVGGKIGFPPFSIGPITIGGGGVGPGSPSDGDGNGAKLEGEI